MGKINITEVLLLVDYKQKMIATKRGGDTFSLDTNVESFLEGYCLASGSTIKGRKDAFKHWLCAHQKIPIMIKHDIIFFALESPRNYGCVWLAYHHIKKIRWLSADKTMIIFREGYKTVVEFNYRIIVKQIKRCREYLKILEHLEV